MFGVSGSSYRMQMDNTGKGKLGEDLFSYERCVSDFFGISDTGVAVDSDEHEYVIFSSGYQQPTMIKEISFLGGVFIRKWPFIDDNCKTYGDTEDTKLSPIQRLRWNIPWTVIRYGRITKSLISVRARAFTTEV